MMVGVVVLVVAAPWPPGALTLALSRRAGEGTVVVGGGASATRVVFQEMGLLRGGGWLLWERAGDV